MNNFINFESLTTETIGFTAELSSVNESQTETLLTNCENSEETQSSNKSLKKKMLPSISYPAKLPILSNSVENALTFGEIVFYYIF